LEFVDCIAIEIGLEGGVGGMKGDGVSQVEFVADPKVGVKVIEEILSLVSLLWGLGVSGG